MWETLVRLFERLVTLAGVAWVSVRAARSDTRARQAEHALKVKDEQMQAADDRARDRDDLVRRLREHGL